MKFRSGLLRPPRIRTERLEEHRHASWLELFLDLAYVAVIGQLATLLAADFSFPKLGLVVVVFIPIWWSWVGQAFYLTRFDSDDVGHRVFVLLQMIAVAGMAVTVGRVFEGRPEGFVASYVGARMILVAQYAVVYRVLPRARALAKWYMIAFSASICLWLISLLVPPPLMLPLWLAAILVDVLGPLSATRHAVEIPPDPEHIPERFGLFTIIVLGEGLIAVVGSLNNQPLGWGGALAGIAGLVLAFCLWWVYFDGIEAAGTMQVGNLYFVRNTRRWLLSHLPLHAGIVVMAVGVKLAIKVPVGAPFKGDGGLIFCLAVATVFLMKHSIYRTRIPKSQRYIRYELGHILTSLAILPVLILSPILPALAVVTVVALLAANHILLSFRERPNLPEVLGVKLS